MNVSVHFLPWIAEYIASHTLQRWQGAQSGRGEPSFHPFGRSTARRLTMNDGRPQRPPENIAKCHFLRTLYEKRKVLEGRCGCCSGLLPLLWQRGPGLIEVEQVAAWLQTNVDDKDGNVCDEKRGKVHIEPRQIRQSKDACCRAGHRSQDGANAGDGEEG